MLGSSHSLALGAKALDLIGLVVQMVKAAAAFFGHITLVGLIAVFSLSHWSTGFCNAVFGGKEFLTQVGIEATQQLGSCTIVVTSAAVQALEIAAAALEGVLLTLEGNRCIGDGAARCVSLTLRARGLLRGGHVLGLRMLIDEATRLGADKVLVQKSGFFGRSAAPNARDLDLIRRSAAVGARAALDGVSGVAGMDEDHGGEMSVIAFPRIKGGKPQSHGVDAGKRPLFASKAEAEATPRVDVDEVSMTLVSRGERQNKPASFQVFVCKGGREDTGRSSLGGYVCLRVACSDCLSSSCFT